MVQGPNELDALKPVLPPSNPANPDAVHRNKIYPPLPIPLTQAADTVHLSPNAVQALAAKAKFDSIGQVPSTPALPVSSLPAAGTPVKALVPGPGPLPPVLGAAPAAGAPASVVSEKTAPVQALAASGLATPAGSVLQSEPEVRPGRVQEVMQNLPVLTGNSGAMNAQLAEKLLIGF